MDYRRFEWLVIATTATLVAGALALSWSSGGGAIVEVAAQLGIVVVVATAAHWGRKAGTVCALVASVAYLWLRMPLIATSVSGPAVVLMISRIAGYLLLGIVGGEVFGRIKYVFARSHSAGAIDDFSRVYSQRFVWQTLRQALQRCDRYDESFALVFIALDPQFAANARVGHRRNIVRSVANVIRDDVRIVDDVAHLEDGRFTVLLSHASGADARIVAARLIAAIISAHGVEAKYVKAEALAVPQDREALDAFCTQIQPVEEDYPASGE